MFGLPASVTVPYPQVSYTALALCRSSVYGQFQKNVRIKIFAVRQAFFFPIFAALRRMSRIIHIFLPKDTKKVLYKFAFFLYNISAPKEMPSKGCFSGEGQRGKRHEQTRTRILFPKINSFDAFPRKECAAAETLQHFAAYAAASVERKVHYHEGHDYRQKH